MIFETERLLVREYRPEEFELFYQLNGNADVVRYIRPVQQRPEAKDFFQQLVRAYRDNPGLGRWAAFTKPGNAFIGSFAIIPIPWDADKLQLGYALAPGHWGKGYATELTRGGIEYYWKSFPRDIIYAMTETENVASQKVLLKAGFQFDKMTKDGEKDIIVFNLRRQS